MSVGFVLKSVLLGVGLAMDAFSVSVANGLHEPKMRVEKICGIAGVFAFFQALMPMIGWICVHTLLQYFQVFERFIPWIALILLTYIGGKMLLEGRKKEEEKEQEKLTRTVLIMQGIATSIDALSVGFTIADYDFPMAFICAMIIAAVTFIVCIGGVLTGRTVGNRYSANASVFGGIILIVIGLEIFLQGFLR